MQTKLGTIRGDDGTVDTFVHIPPYQVIVDRLNDGSEKKSNGTIAISDSFLVFLLSHWVLRAPFDEAYYVRTNQDISEALSKGSISSAEEHFRSRGYFEGRLGAPVKVDRAFYLAAYPDVAKAFARGLIKDVQSHYDETGRFEGRFANAVQKDQLERWAHALGNANKT